jgi:hypothetical protein
MKVALIFLLYFILTNNFGQNLENTYKGKFSSKIMVENEEVEEFSVPFEIELTWRTISNSNFFLVIIEKAEKENNTGMRLNNQSNDTILFDTKKLLAFDFSKRTCFSYQNYASGDFKKDNEKFVGKKSTFYVDKTLPKQVTPLPIFANIHDKGILRIEGKTLNLVYQKSEKNRANLKRIAMKCQSFKKSNDNLPMPF